MSEVDIDGLLDDVAGALEKKGFKDIEIYDATQPLRLPTVEFTTEDDDNLYQLELSIIQED